MPIAFFTLTTGLLLRVAFSPARELPNIRTFHLASGAYARRNVATPSLSAAVTSSDETGAP